MVIKKLKNLPIFEEDCIFTKPDFKNWSAIFQKNRESLSVVNNRDTCRKELIDIAAKYTNRIGLQASSFKNEMGVIVTGHQPNWHHCGIFAKNVITDNVASQIGGTAVQLVLDHDICNTSMSLPEMNDNGFLQFKTILLEQKHQNTSLELRSVPPRKQLRKFIDSVSKTCKGAICSEIWCRNLHRIIENKHLSKNVADIITNFQSQLDTDLGLGLMYLPVSLMSKSDSFTGFVYSIIGDAIHFVKIYNRAIKNKINSENLKPNQTVKSLKIDYLNKIVELPFWLILQKSKRCSLYVSFNGETIQIGTDENIIGTIDSSYDKKQQLIDILRKNKCVIRPKAVTLTLFARMYLADLFVHGTGADNYEYITDHLIKNYYKILKMNFGIATATMTLPSDAGNKNSEIAKEVLNYREFFFGLFSRSRLEKLLYCSQRNQNEDRVNSCFSSR